MLDDGSLVIDIFQAPSGRSPSGFGLGKPVAHFGVACPPCMLTKASGSWRFY
jgi:hypothetical protein